MKENNLKKSYLSYDLLFPHTSVVGFCWLAFLDFLNAHSLVQQFFIARQVSREDAECGILLSWKKAHSWQNGAMQSSPESLNK